MRQLPLDSHPIYDKKIGKDIGTRAPHKANAVVPNRVKPVGLIYDDTLQRHARQAVVGSNRSVYSEEKIESAAWMIQEDNQKPTTAYFLMEIISSTVGELFSWS